MDIGHIIVFLLLTGVVVLLVLVEINSRRNDAKQKAESSAKAGASASSQAEPQLRRKAGQAS